MTVMTYVSIQDIAASWDSYERFLARLTEPAPDGLILYVAGPTDEGCRIVAVWDSEESHDRFDRDRLAPVLASISGPIPPDLTVRTLRGAHVVSRMVHPKQKEFSC